MTATTLERRDLTPATTQGSVDRILTKFTEIDTQLDAIGEQTGVTTATADAAYAILKTDKNVEVSTTGAGGPHALTAAADLPAGSKIGLFMTAFSTGTYTMAVTGGTLTFNLANEAALVYYTGTVFRVLSLNGATVV